MAIDPTTFAAAQAGDPKALEHLLVRLRPDVYRYVRRQCYASTAIEDVVQEALKLLTSLCMLPVLMFMQSKSRSTISFTTWCTR